MITKKLMKDIVTFCNQYINNSNIVININKYSYFVGITFGIWNLNGSLITDHIGSIHMYIKDEVDLNKFKDKVFNELPLLLQQVKNN